MRYKGIIKFEIESDSKLSKNSLLQEINGMFDSVNNTCANYSVGEGLEFFLKQVIMTNKTKKVKVK